MKHRLAHLVLIGAFFLSPAHAEKIFHPPRTDAEESLDAILRLNKTDADLSEFILKIPNYNRAREKEFMRLFTAPLLESWKESYTSVSKEDEPLMDIDFITCEQDAPESYEYYTIKNDGHVAFIFSAWSPTTTHTAEMIFSSKRPPYRMVKQGGTWRLDGVFCPGDWRFNTDFNYTKR